MPENRWNTGKSIENIWEMQFSTPHYLKGEACTLAGLTSDDTRGCKWVHDLGVTEWNALNGIIVKKDDASDNVTYMFNERPRELVRAWPSHAYSEDPVTRRTQKQDFIS